jgi:NAD(P)H-dependent flavin oxidoreductase YrpB (nitropropane dioxygenase family)
MASAVWRKALRFSALRPLSALSQGDPDNKVKLMWPRTDFLELLGITHPVIQAPMSGFTPPQLAAAVCNAGGLGSIGCARTAIGFGAGASRAVASGNKPPIQSQLFCP